MLPSISVLGVPVAPVTWPELREEVIRRVAAGRRTTVMYANVHVVNTAQRDRALHDALARADLVYCDGEGVRVGARVLGHRLPARMTGADFIWDLASRLATAATRVYWIGGTPGTAGAALARLAAHAPQLHVAGADHGYFAKDGPATDAVIARINAARPGLVMIGMGTPIQERWVDRYRHRIEAPVVWCIGATADFVAGVQPRGPALLTDHGLEWLARLASDPRRLFGRYVVGNPMFLARVLRTRLRGR